MLSMQDALLALTKYWTDHGCMTVQPFNTEVGAGTWNPATALRVLGPEPWRVAYVEPSVRPDDARYGDNPNRLQTHTQFQVILKPDPGNPQELFLGSLAALGIDIDAHDVRFVEDNWASPALGAWGLGWEVWLDGLEITQFTYFQQAGGLTLDPVSVEITYGIERIMMALQKVNHFKDISYAPGISYGEVFGQAEYEMSRYYLDDADVETNRRLFADYALEAERMIAARLPVPAHYCVLKCSHTFNVLDARGAVSTTERAKAFGRMRGLSRQIATLWQERREELAHPLGISQPPQAASQANSHTDITQPATLLFEIGVEELPPAVTSQVVEHLRTALTSELAETRLEHGAIHTYATPRRIVALVEEVAAQEPDVQRTVRGPRTSLAFDETGQPTKAAIGFARGQGIDVTELQRTTMDGDKFVAANVTDLGRSAVDVLTELLGQIVLELRADKNMRWNDPQLSFSRPVRWLVALLDEVELPIVVSSLSGGRMTRVHRTAEEPVVPVHSARGYRDFLAGHGIVLDQDQRREQVITGIQQLAAEVGGEVDLTAESALIDEITNLVEQPTPILGSFDEKYLDLPSEILTTVMRKHQRYVPIRDADGTLLPHFVAVANGSCDRDIVRAGNEAVLRARYEDAAFFWRADLDVKPETMKVGLTKLAFEQQLGSMADRAHRIAGIAESLGCQVLSPGEQAVLARAAELAKFDLASHMVIELTSLAGTMAKEYALRAGEPPAIAQALFDMELPRTAGGALPTTAAGAVLALADRLDLLAGLFAIGANPRGSSDPFALRRAALGAINVLRATPALGNVSLAEGLAVASEQLARQGISVAGEAVDHAHEFIVRRYEQQLHDLGHDHRLVAAVLPLTNKPAHAEKTLSQLIKLAPQAEFHKLVAAIERVRRIVPADTSTKTGAKYDLEYLREPAEVNLAETFSQARTAMVAADDLQRFVRAAEVLVDPINVFFDEILVMSDDPQVRAARLGLLASIRDVATAVLNWQPLASLQTNA